MNAYTVRRVLAACAVAGSILMVPSESQAIFHWFGGGCGSCGGGGGGTTAYRPYTAAYAPYYAAYPAAPACNTCSPCAQTCNYMPQTCYRTVYQQVPVTAYQPVASCDPCGNQVTAYRPVVTYQTQARLVPYTSYRPVYAPAMGCSPVGCATGGCASVGCPTGGCATGSCGTNVSYASPVSSSSSGCSSVTDPESRLRPIPDSSNSQDAEAKNKATNSTLTPRLLNPDDRTTYRPLNRTATVIPVAAEESVDDEGWRPARR